MSEWVLLWVYSLSALVAGMVFYAAARAPGLSSLRIGLLTYLFGTGFWAIVDVVRWIVGPSSIPMVEAWTLPAGALVITGLRMGVHAATHPGWKVARGDIASYALHPLLTVMVAVIPALWPYVAAADASGEVNYGPLFWAHVAILYALSIAATMEMFKSRGSLPSLHFRTTPVIVSIMAIPLVVSAVTIVSFGPMGVDLMPAAFAVTALIIWKTLVPLDMRKAVRIARSQVLEELADAVIVLGNEGQILDANASALKLVGAEGGIASYVDKSLRQAWPGIADATAHPGEHDLVANGAEVVLDVTIAPLSEEDGAPSGRAVVLRNVTEAVLLRRELARLRVELADLVVRDAVTGLHNRRFAEQNLPEVLARCVSKRVPMSIAMIDVDHFKNVNDTHGHPVGDRVLREVARAMLEEVPASMIARIGGEEFLILLAGLSSDRAFAHTEKLRDACARASVSTREGEVRVTVSAGIATTRDGALSVEALMEAADAALYRAKREGRNRSCASDATPPPALT